MNNGYVKAVGSTPILSKVISVDPSTTEDGSDQKNVAVPGFLKYQEFFFFDARNPESARDAVNRAERFVGSFDGKRPPKLSIYGRPKFSGPWDQIPDVGHGIGEA